MPYVKSYYLREHMEFLDPCIRTADKGYTKSRPSKRASSVDLTQEDPIENDDLSLNCSKIKFEEIIIPENRTQETNSDYTLKRSDNEKPKVPDVNEPIHDRSSTSFLESSMNNSRAMFLMSLLPEVDEMTEKRFRQFKRKILTIIDDINSQNSN